MNVAQDRARDVISSWPKDVREAAEPVIRKYGEPDEATPSMLIWYNNGPWKQTVVFRETAKHDFPIPHTDLVEQSINYSVPVNRMCELAIFDGSVSVQRTRGMITARCHDEEANFLAINLAHDIVQGKKSPEEAREFYAQSMLDFRAGKPVPYMQKFQFTPPGNTAYSDQRALSDEQLREAKERGGEK